jgi:hypothetical protein
MVASRTVTSPIELTPALGVLLLTGCVPRDATENNRAEPEAISSSAVTQQRWRPHASYAQKHDGSSGRSTVDHRTLSSGADDPTLTAPFRDSFERSRPGDDWTSTSEDWSIESGLLCGQRNRNHPIWLKYRIPRNAQISFLARAKSSNGDIKAEVWGDGRSFARSTSYNDATSYIFIFGGWKNQLHVLARLSEHDPNRMELRLDRSSVDKRLLPVTPNVDYRFVIERRDGKSILWRVDGLDLIHFEDKEPLHGQEHDHFGFNNWETPVCFDELTITPLPE